jgi:hypothetical protein
LRRPGFLEGFGKGFVRSIAFCFAKLRRRRGFVTVRPEPKVTARSRVASDGWGVAGLQQLRDNHAATYRKAWPIFEVKSAGIVSDKNGRKRRILAARIGRAAANCVRALMG